MGIEVTRTTSVLSRTMKDMALDCFDKINYENEKNSFKMILSIEIINEEKSNLYPAGFGRNFPNSNPYLEDPMDI